MFEFISILALVFLSLFGYSTGAVLGSRRSDLAPDIVDLLLPLVILATAFAVDGVSGLNRWSLVFIALPSSGLIGFLRTLLRNHTQTHQSGTPSNKQPRGKGLWARWVGLSTRIGAFQSRIILSFLYLIVVSLVALPTRLFSDPLQLRLQERPSYWSRRLERKILEGALKQH